MADELQVRLLGGFQAHSGDRIVPPGAWRLRKSQTLVKLLALQPSYSMRRDAVVDALWPDASPQAGRNNLNQVVHAARRALSALEVEGAITTTGELVSLGPAGRVRTDVVVLRHAVTGARDRGDAATVARLLLEAPPELLPDDAHEPWAEQHATAFREWRTPIAIEAAEALLGAGEADLAVTLVAPVLRAQTLHEPAARMLMRALDAAGRRAEALQTYEQLRDVLRDELGADPEPATRALFRGMLQESPPAVVVPMQSGVDRLPQRATALVGRDRELDETQAILRRTRVLTLTGMGGAGKTTLGIELARRCAAEYAGEVYLVELAAVTDGDDVARQLGRAMRLALSPGTSTLQAVVAQLRHRRALVVLDNCEHLVEAAAETVVEVVRWCPEIRFVVTSREPLRIDGEVAWRTPSLALPDPTARVPLNALAQVDSVTLFCRRASAASPSFRLSRANAAAVAEICYRLDGIPLALELAAACIPVLSPEQIASRLAASLELPARAGRATITRQQTLSATLQWSYGLLRPTEQALLRRLSVFAGWFTLDAVQEIAGGDDDDSAVLDDLARLVDTSLLVADERDGLARYRLLETVRQFAAEKLRAGNEVDVYRARHCHWYLRYALARDPELSLAPTAPPNSVDAEHDNLRAALAWSLQHEPDTGLELAVALWRYWLARGLFAEGRVWLERALQANPTPGPTRARALLALAVIDVRRGDASRLAQLAAEAVATHRALESKEGLAQALLAEAVLAYMRGNWAEAWERANDAQHVAPSDQAARLAVTSRHLQAVILLARDQRDDAESALEQVRLLLDEVPTGTPPFFAPLLLGFNVQGVETGAVRIYFEETVLLGRTVGVEQADAYLLLELADVERGRGRLDRCLDRLFEAHERFLLAGDIDGQALALSRLGSAQRQRGDTDGARDALTRSLVLRRALGDRRSIGLTESNLGLVAVAEGDLTRGQAMIEEAFRSFTDIEDGAAATGLSLTLATVNADAGDFVAAEPRLRAALTRATNVPGNARASAWGYAFLADVLGQIGRPQEADAARLEAAHRLQTLGIVTAKDLQSAAS